MSREAEWHAGDFYDLVCACTDGKHNNNWICSTTTSEPQSSEDTAVATARRDQILADHAAASEWPKWRQLEAADQANTAEALRQRDKQVLQTALATEGMSEAIRQRDDAIRDAEAFKASAASWAREYELIKTQMIAAASAITVLQSDLVMATDLLEQADAALYGGTLDTRDDWLGALAKLREQEAAK